MEEGRGEKEGRGSYLATMFRMATTVSRCLRYVYCRLIRIKQEMGKNK